MATWIAHIRLAENLLNYGFELDVPSFLAGNIAPDSGIPSPEGYIPDKKITHWKDMNDNIQPEDFYAAHLEGKSYSREEYAFLMGYYLHLVADLEWMGNVWQPNIKTNPIWQALDENNPEHIRLLKKDWYGLDFAYLHHHPDSRYFSDFMKLEQVPDYLEIFPKGAFTECLQKIKAYYANEARTEEALDHNFSYLNEEDMLTWIDCTTVTMLGLLKSKGVSCPNPQPLFGEKYIQTAL